VNILFVHTNFPAQFVHLAPALAARGHRVRAIGSHTARTSADVGLVRYQLSRGSTPNIFAPATRFEADCLRGAGAAGAARALAESGFQPDVIFGHLGWGETLFLSQIWPNARQLIYAEFHVAPNGYDVGFDPEFPATDNDSAMRILAKNASISMVMANCTRAVSPTAFQRSSFPQLFADKIDVIHDGIDTQTVKPSAQARLSIESKGLIFKPGDPVITYVNRHLEPLRGIHQMLRAAPAILAANKDAHVVIVGSPDGSPYGAPPPAGTSWRDVYLAELGDRLDLSRVHFLGRVDRATFLSLLNVSAAHIYLTYPFVLSWSLLEAMSAGCAIVASDTAPVREVITNMRNGLLVDFFDPQAISSAALDMVARPHAYGAMRAVARADAIARYDLKTICLPSMTHFVEKYAA
jgi:glycosyltransferase involved in cell wall biosynthesis